MKLYDEWVRENSRTPRYQPPLQTFTHNARCDNPLCGDRIDVTLQVEGGVVQKVGVKARACAITKASASLMSTLVEGHTRDELAALAELARAAVAPGAPPAGDLAPLAVVREAPSRRRCATLPWEALITALDAQT